jgi:hypothetical protein
VRGILLVFRKSIILFLRAEERNRSPATKFISSQQ